MKPSIRQTTLKWIALSSMLIDHIGVVFFENILLFRMVGRLAFPIFAFLIARGFAFTKHRGRYLGRLIVFGALSILPYYFVFGVFYPNILFTFALSIVLMWGFEYIQQSNLSTSSFQKALRFCLLLIWVLLMAMIATVFMFEYSFLGVLLPFVFWLLKDFEKEKYIVFGMLTVFYTFLSISESISVANLSQLLSLFSIPLLAITSEKQSVHAFKWLFYVFYPSHLVVLYLISLL